MNCFEILEVLLGFLILIWMAFVFLVYLKLVLFVFCSNPVC